MHRIRNCLWGDIVPKGDQAYCPIRSVLAQRIGRLDWNVQYRRFYLSQSTWRSCWLVVDQEMRKRRSERIQYSDHHRS